jgi:hypothetical protein
VSVPSAYVRGCFHDTSHAQTQTWRQLWRVAEVSDVIVLICDVRFAVRTVQLFTGSRLHLWLAGAAAAAAMHTHTHIYIYIYIFLHARRYTQHTSWPAYLAATAFPARALPVCAGGPQAPPHSDSQQGCACVPVRACACACAYVCAYVCLCERVRACACVCWIFIICSSSVFFLSLFFSFLIECILRQASSHSAHS